MPSSRSELSGKPPRQFSLMTAYQFVFYTMYQACHWQVSDKFAEWKAGLVVGVLEMAIIISVVVETSVLLHANDLPPEGFLYVIALSVAAGIYYTFDRHDRWKVYAKEFERYTRRELFIGRVLVVLGVVLIVSALVFSLYSYRRLHGFST